MQLTNLFVWQQVASVTCERTAHTNHSQSSPPYVGHIATTKVCYGISVTKGKTFSIS